MSKRKKRFTSCAVMRRKFVTHSKLDLASGAMRQVSTEWVTEPCGVPLFGDDHQASGVCRSCAGGWKHPNNYPADEPQPSEEIAE